MDELGILWIKLRSLIPGRGGSVCAFTLPRVQSANPLDRRISSWTGVVWGDKVFRVGEMFCGYFFF